MYKVECTTRIVLLGALSDVCRRKVLPQLLRDSPAHNPLIIAVDLQSPEAFTMYMNAGGLEGGQSLAIQYLSLDVTDPRQWHQHPFLHETAHLPTVCYMALPPNLFVRAGEAMARAGIIRPDRTVCLREKPWATSKQALLDDTRALLECGFPERQLHNIDHYLLKWNMSTSLDLLQEHHPELTPFFDVHRLQQVRLVTTETRGAAERLVSFPLAPSVADYLSHHIALLWNLLKGSTGLGSRQHWIQCLPFTLRHHETVLGQYITGPAGPALKDEFQGHNAHQIETMYGVTLQLHQGPRTQLFFGMRAQQNTCTSRLKLKSPIHLPEMGWVDTLWIEHQPRFHLQVGLGPPTSQKAYPTQLPSLLCNAPPASEYAALLESAFTGPSGYDLQEALCIWQLVENIKAHTPIQWWYPAGTLDGLHLLHHTTLPFHNVPLS